MPQSAANHEFTVSVERNCADNKRYNMSISTYYFITKIDHLLHLNLFDLCGVPRAVFVLEHNMHKTHSQPPKIDSDMLVAVGITLAIQIRLVSGKGIPLQRQRSGG